MDRFVDHLNAACAVASIRRFQHLQPGYQPVGIPIDPGSTQRKLDWVPCRAGHLSRD